MVNFGIHRGQAVAPANEAIQHTISRSEGALEHLERAGLGPEADPLLDAHAELAFADKMKRAYTAQGNIWARVVYGAGVGTTKERLNNLWNTTSLVSALLMTFTYSYIANPVRSDAPLDPNSTRAIALDFANVSGILSFVMSLFCLMFNVVFHEVDYCTTGRDERDFVLRFAGLFDSIAGLFGGSVGMLLLSVLCTIYAIHPIRTFYIIVGACILLALALFGCTVPITVFTRFRLWVRLEGGSERGADGGGSDGAAGSKAVVQAAAVAEGRLTGDACDVPGGGGEGRRQQGLQERRAAGTSAVEAAGFQRNSGRTQAFVNGRGAEAGLRGESTLRNEH